MEPTPAESVSENDPWYAPGLHFTCTQCGNCCSGAPGFVWVEEAEIQAIARHLDVPVGEVRLLHARRVGDRVSLREHANGACIYLEGKTRRCTIYPVRPQQCRTWPFWRSNLESPETWQNVQTTCPGAGQGAFVPLDQIQKQTGIVDL